MPSIFRLSKDSAFLHLFLSYFGKILAPNTPVWAKICTKGPSFLHVLRTYKIRSVDPNFVNPCGTYIPTKKTMNE